MGVKTELIISVCGRMRERFGGYRERSRSDYITDMTGVWLLMGHIDKWWKHRPMMTLKQSSKDLTSNIYYTHQAKMLSLHPVSCT